MGYLASLTSYPAQLLAVFLIGVFFHWVFRKLRARFQARMGPPWYQSFMDIVKLFSKECIIPSTAGRIPFIMAPLISFTGYLVIALMVPVSRELPTPLSFAGDLIVILVALAVPSIAVILGGISSASPYGAIGASREASLLVASEAVLMASALTPAIYSGTLNLAELIEAQATSEPFAAKFPFATGAFFICILLKLGRKPFDIPEADVEIVAGPYTEYSGPLLGFFEISNMLRWSLMPALGVNLFLSGGRLTGMPQANTPIFLAISLVVVALASYLDSQNPRWRIDQAFKHLFTWVMVLSIIDGLRAATGVGLW
ncbi:MAG: respiratory chain complex I subunit 1 family protein [Candidatus Bathyarchaeia archaeon]